MTYTFLVSLLSCPQRVPLFEYPSGSSWVPVFPVPYPDNNVVAEADAEADAEAVADAEADAEAVAVAD